MLRTIDHSGYYETRLILMAVSLAITTYFIYYKRDRRYLLMFFSGAFIAALTEYFLQAVGLRGAGFSISLFNQTVPKLVGPIVQGITEGGAWSVFAFWFADLRSTRTRQRQWWAFFVMAIIVIAFAFVAGAVARNQPISSVRPMFAPISIIIITSIIFISLLIAWHKDALSDLANFYGGLLLFAFLNLEPLHLMGARFIGVYSASQPIRVSTSLQITMMFLSNIFESSGSRLPYFMLPFAFGLVALRGRQDTRPRERYSTQHLQDLAQRGWRKRSKPFQHD